MNYNEIIVKVIDYVGGESNIAGYTSCMTRLRITLIDTSKVSKKDLETIEEILGVNENGEELQLIFGPGKVKKAHETMSNLVQIDDDFERTIKEQKDNVKSKRTSGFQQFMSKFSNIFVPLIPGFIAAGILAGFAGLLTSLSAYDTFSFLASDTAQAFIAYLNVFNKSLLTFMYIMIGYNAAGAFGGTGVIGGIVAGLFLLGYGDFSGAEEAIKYGGTVDSGMDTIFGLTIDPRGGIIGVLFGSIIGAYVEQIVRKYFSWEPTDIITTPMITLIIMSLLCFVVIMPLSSILFDGMNWAFANLNSNPIGAAILSALFLPTVMMGIHQGFVPVYQGLVETIGVNSLFPILAMAGAAQVGTAIALWTLSKKDSKLRRNINGAIIPGFLGIGEPLIYGVTLPRVIPFFTSMVGAAIGGFYIGLLAMFGLTFGLNTVFGASGLLATFAMTTPDGNVLVGMGLYLSALVITYIAGYLVTLLGMTLFGKNVDLS